jgi:hypothetical protein
MKNNTIYSFLGAALLVTTLTACPGDTNDDTGGSTNADTGDTPATTSGTTVDPTNPPTTTTVDPTTTTVDPSTSSSTTVDPDTTIDPSTTVDPTETTGDPGFVFPEDAFEDYVQIDRHGAVEAGTAGIKAGSGLGFMGEDIAVRDDYNASNPVDDADGLWVPEIGASVTFFHDNLDDDLMMLGLTPATVMESVMQAGPVIIPDTIKWDPNGPTGYPNGRALTDPVVDITLAAVLLKLGPNQPLDAFVGVLNPETNDVPFLAEFPFLAPPHL